MIKYSTFILLFSFLFTDSNKSADEILLSSLHRLNGINYSFQINVNDKSKKSIKKYKIFCDWPDTGLILSQTRIISLDKKRKKPSSVWIHQYKNSDEPKKWISMPITGKLKDFSDKNYNFDFSLNDLVVTEKDIKLYKNELIGEEIKEGVSYYIISSNLLEHNKLKDIRKIWIESETFMIMKMEFYTSSNRLFRSIECIDLIPLSNVSFPSMVRVNDYKSKKEIMISIENILLNPEIDINIFSPINQ